MNKALVYTISMNVQDSSVYPLPIAYISDYFTIITLITTHKFSTINKINIFIFLSTNYYK